jgi:hypothetical protein
MIRGFSSSPAVCPMGMSVVGALSSDGKGSGRFRPTPASASCSALAWQLFCPINRNHSSQSQSRNRNRHIISIQLARKLTCCVQATRRCFARTKRFSRKRTEYCCFIPLWYKLYWVSRPRCPAGITAITISKKSFTSIGALHIRETFFQLLCGPKCLT